MAGYSSASKSTRFNPRREPRAFQPCCSRSREHGHQKVSIPDGNQGPFSRLRYAFNLSKRIVFQSQTGTRGLVAHEGTEQDLWTTLVSIPDGNQELFSLFLKFCMKTSVHCFNPRRKP